MKRGDVLTVEGSGDCRKPRPAVIVQTDGLPAEHALSVVCQMTSELTEAPHFSVTIKPSQTNGLPVRLQVIGDKPVTIRRERIAQSIGRLDDKDGRATQYVALAFVMGLAD